MKRNWVLALTLSVIACLAPPTRLHCQDNSPKESQDVPPPYRVGNGVKPPRTTYQPMPEYDDESRKEHVEGEVALSLIVTKEGAPRDIKVVRTLSKHLDEQAIKAVSQWRFDPATKDGIPVAVKIDVEVTFSLGGKHRHR